MEGEAANDLRCLAVWRYDKGAFKDIDVFVAMVGMPPTHGPRHHVSDSNDRFFLNDIGEVRPM